MENLSKNEWKGHIAMAKFDMRAAEKNVVVSSPQVSCRYDRVADIDGKMQRVQVKYAGTSPIKSTGATIAKLKRPRNRKGDLRGYTKEEIDAIVLYIPQVDKLCWFDAKYFEGKTEICVRYEKAKNGQKMTNWIDDFAW